MEDWDGAYRSFRKAADLDPVNHQPYDGLAQACLARKEYDEALRHIAVAIERCPGTAKLYVDRGNALAFKKDFEGAIAAYQQALALFPDYGMAHRNLAQVLLLAGKDVAQAIEHYEAAIRNDPTLTDAYPALASLYLSQARLRQGPPGLLDSGGNQPEIGHGTRLLHRRATARPGRGGGAAVRGSGPGARPAVGRGAQRPHPGFAAEKGHRRGPSSRLEAVTQFPDMRELRDTLGTAWYWKCDFDKSVANHRLALKMNPASGVTYENIGLALRAKGDLAGAADAFRTAARLDNRNCQGHELLVETLQLMRRFDDAVAVCREKINRDRDDMPSYTALATVLMEQGEFDKAEETLREAQARLPLFDPRREGLRQGLGMVELWQKARERLPAVLRGDDQPANLNEQFLFGVLCAKYNLKRAAAAGARLLAQVLADPKWRPNPQFQVRYYAAWGAATAGTGGSEDSIQLNAEERVRLRQQALQWLRADLALWKGSLAVENPISRATVNNTLRHLAEPTPTWSACVTRTPCSRCPPRSGRSG